MDDLSSLNLSETNKMGPRRTTKGRGYIYTALEPEEAATDDVPNISDDEESGQDTEVSARAGRKKWQSRLKANSSLVGWVWNGGCQLLMQRRVNDNSGAFSFIMCVPSGLGTPLLLPVKGAIL